MVESWCILILATPLLDIVEVVEVKVVVAPEIVCSLNGDVSFIVNK